MLIRMLSKKQLTMGNVSLIFSVVFLFSVLSLPLQGEPQEDSLQKRLEYEVSVSAQLVPIFAVDSQGNPVYDLKKEEIELYADGKPAEIIFFTGYRLEGQQQVKRREKVPAVKSPERINFIILDTLVSNKNTLGLARHIAMGIINNASPGDSFVILESNQIRGFQYVTGPEKDKSKLVKAMKEIEKRFRRRRIWSTIDINNPVHYTDEMAMALLHQRLLEDNNRAQREKEKYQRDIKTFTRALQQLKYALKTITLPKTVFLISAGQINYALGRMPVTYYRFLENAAKAVNYGGGMFYLINPFKQDTGLKFMADHVGGRYVSGSNIKEIVTTVKKSTSAYYELAFYPEKSGDKNRVKLECKRKGVRLTTINFSERSKPYRQMNFTEKKMFALNVVNGGSWSRMVGRVGKIKYKRFSSKEVDLKNIQINIPPVMRNIELDVFRLNIDPVTRKAEIVFENKKMGETEKIQMETREDKTHYFVIIEPTKTFCIYNQVD